MDTSQTASDTLPYAFNPANVDTIENVAQDFLEQTLDDETAIERWLLELSRFFEVIDEYGTRTNIENACHTDDEKKERAYIHWIRDIHPKLKPLFYELQRKYLAATARSKRPQPATALMDKQWRVDVSLYRAANIPLQTRLAELAKEYGKITAAMTVDYQGETLTLQQLSRFLEETERNTRQDAWERMVARRLEDRERLEALFDEQLSLRHRIAANAGREHFRSYMWSAKKRFDFTPEDCLAFGQAVEKVCVPLVEHLDRERRQRLGVDTLRPWDTLVDVRGRPPLRPYDARDVDRFAGGTQEIFRRIAPDFAEQFIRIHEQGNLDLASRKGKRPGGFHAQLEASRESFIFMNAAGLQRDVETLLHEGGHAFHHAAASAEPNYFMRDPPLEFAEVASMSMELMGADHFDAFYTDAEEATRAKRQLFEGVIRIFPWVATIDGFQHWLYTHPGHSRQEREAAWGALLDRFESDVVDYSGYEEARATRWQRQVHLFEAPFYYIEYGIAQLGALGVWLNYKRDPHQALDRLQRSFTLGGTQPLPQLFEAAGIPFDFSADRLHELIDAVEQELAGLPC